jgi:hypothetical protein
MEELSPCLARAALAVMELPLFSVARFSDLENTSRMRFKMPGMQSQSRRYGSQKLAVRYHHAYFQAYFMENVSHRRMPSSGASGDQ